MSDFLQTDGPNRVMVDVYLKSAYSDSASFDAELAALRDAGLEVVATHNSGQLPVAEGWIDVGRVNDVARLDSTRSVIAVSKPGIDTGGTLSQGDASHNGPAARALGANGSGVTVGVISDSINQVGDGVAGSQATGDLPAAVTVLLDAPDASDEGRAMAEIIYDTAPGVSEILFSSGTTAGPVAKANSIDTLVANGAGIIADDIFYLDEPMFQDGVIAQAVDNARAAGVTYFASAGNRARQSWEGTYTDTGGFHNFGAADTVQTVATVPNDSFLQITLQWNEAWGSAASDIDAVLVRSDGAPLGCGSVSGGIDDNPGTGLPKETIFFENTCGASVNVGFKIQRYSGSGSPVMKYIARGNFGAFSVAEYNTSSNAINPDAASAAGSIAVAAINWNEAGLNDPESFSSRGKITRRRDKNGVPLVTPLVRQKPQIAAADGVATSVPGYATFFGTSAAVPSVAGVASLVKSSYPTATPAQVEAILTNPANTINCTAPNNPDGSDDDCGFGFVLADKAVAQAKALAAVTPFSPFVSWSAFITRQHLDLTAKTPTPAAVSTSTAALAAGSKTKGDLIETLRRGSDNTTNVDPTARLYRAFLGRAPDAGGLKFWVNRRRTGTWTLTRMADSFAGSNEFKTKYGTLTNRQFVTRIYTDVLGRTADTSGVNYWTGKLDRKERTRGGVMVGFSESNEYKRKQAENTDVAVAYIFLMGRAPTTAETTRWVTRQKAGTTQAALATELLNSAKYARRITG